jgi:hypothetical protein
MGKKGKNRKNNANTESACSQVEQQQEDQFQVEQQSSGEIETLKELYEAESATTSSTPLLNNSSSILAPSEAKQKRHIGASGKWPTISSFSPKFPEAAPRGSFQDRTSQDAAQSPHSLPFGLKEEEWVESVAPVTDEPHMPAFTIRVILIGVIW